MAIIKKSHYGLNIYAQILQQFYPNEIVLFLRGKVCDPAKNPFNENQKTLQISLNEWVFQFADSEIPDFSGNPFQFASKFYQLQESKLLDAIEKDLNLSWNRNRTLKTAKEMRYPNLDNGDIKIQDVPTFSIYSAPIRNTIPAGEISLSDAYQLITSAKYQQATLNLRSLAEREEARKFKANNFDYVTFSGTFYQRKDSMIKVPSGLMVIDFDHLTIVQEVRDIILQDEYLETEMLFTSPSGDGLKWVISYKGTKTTHEQFFKAVSSYLKQVYKLNVDQSGKDISRACFLPYDPTAFIHPKYGLL